MSEGAQAASADPVVVGLSGGVDSAVTALLLQRQGRNPTAIFMHNWELDDADGECPAEIDARDAAKVAAHIGIDFQVRNLSAAYWDRVFEHFLAEHRAGRTPNPDVLCNREVKFSAFADVARQMGAKRVATGHYARIDRSAATVKLLKGRDPGKDQSYFLHLLDQSQLALAEFPLGELLKSEVRQLATEAGLPVADKRDSTGICFIGEQPHRQFLQRFLHKNPGPMLTPEGLQLGEHQGLAFYTLGQRGGLSLGGQKGGSGEPWYVLHKRASDNALIVGQGGQHPALYADQLLTERGHFIAGTPPANEFRCAAKTRYRQPDQDCRVQVLEDGRWHLHFDQPQRAITPGQSVVLYRDEECLGGAVIASCNAPLADWERSEPKPV